MNRYFEEDSRAELDPWRVISTVLFELESDDIVSVISLAGLHVDWMLTGQQSYSHKTRKRAYLPRVQAAYDLLPDEEKLRVAWIVVSEVVRKGENYADRLNSSLAHIGWKLESGGLTTHDSNVRELFFPKGSTHDAYVEIRKILQKAQRNVIVIDPYMDSSIFKVLATIPSTKLRIQILSFNLSNDFILEAQKFLSQYLHFSLEVRKTKEFHDRFIIVDGKQCHHIGASIKDAGNKAFMISQLEDTANIAALIQQQTQSWNTAGLVI